MYSNRLYSPLRYPGGKSAFAPFVAELMSHNGLVGGEYLEPYAGGAAVALELLFHGVASRIHINDLDPAVFDFWSVVVHQPEEILKLIRDTPINMDQWFHWRGVLRGTIATGQVNRAFATLFMNRTNRSGILKAGVIGGLAQSGAYKLDARFNKDVIAKRIEQIALRASQITVHSKDALVLLKECHKFLPLNSLIYLDPPYYEKGQGLYRNFYEHDDHEKIAKTLFSSKFRRPWLASYDNVAQIRDMYKYAEERTYGLNYTAQTRYVGSEVMFFSDRLSVPKMADTVGACA